MGRKVFCPVTDHALIGVLCDLRVVLRGMEHAQDDTLHGQAPELSSVLCGIASERSEILTGITDVFPYAEFLSLRCDFVLCASEMSISAEKEISAYGGITLECSDVDASIISRIGDISGEFMLGAIITSAMNKAVEANASLAVSPDAVVSLCRSLNDVSASLCMSGDISEVTSTMIRTVIASIRFGGEIEWMSLQKDAGDLVGCASISSVVRAALNKNIFLQNADLFIDGYIESLSVRYRKLVDMKDITLGDVSDWTLNKFYFKEE